MIGVFDSGVGGLTVLGAIRRRLPGWPTIYLGDTARVPYGTKSPEVVVRYSRNNAAHLLRHGIEMLVVACNTASAHALEVLAQELPIPVVGVVEPGVDEAIRLSPGGRIGVIGTEGTVASGAYQRRILQRLGREAVFARPCPLFVPLAEEGWTDGEVPVAVAERYLGELRGRIDTLVLGCTHYPLLREAIATVLGPEVRLVDSGAAVAEAVARKLEERRAAGGGAAEEPARGGGPGHRIFVTDIPSRFEEVAARFLGALPGAVEQTDL
jgi:glutamate racemase